MTEPSPLALAVMVAYCGWDPTMPVTAGTVLLSGDGTAVVGLPSLNVTDVSTVVVTNLDGSTYTASLSGTYPDVGWEQNGVLNWLSGRNGGVWALGSRNIAVTYTGGYSGPPDDLSAALDSVTARMPLTGATQKKLGSAAITYAGNVAAGGLLLVEQMVFDRYRLPRVA